MKTFLISLTTHILCSLLCCWLIIYQPIASHYWTLCFQSFAMRVPLHILCSCVDLHIRHNLYVSQTCHCWVKEQMQSTVSHQQSLCPPSDMGIWANLLGRKKWRLATVLIWSSEEVGASFHVLKDVFYPLGELPLRVLCSFFFFPLGLATFFFSTYRSSWYIQVSPWSVIWAADIYHGLL